MSLEKAQNWLQDHPTNLPALKANLGKISRLQDKALDADKVVRITIRAPALAVSLLARVNQGRGADSGRDRVESPLAAVSLLGDHVSQDLVDGQPIAEEVLTKQHQLLLYHQLVERCLHNESQTEQWARELGYQQMEMFRVGSLLSYIGELSCCAHDFETYLDYLTNIEEQPDESEYFGFSFAELTEALCQTLNLPEIIVNAQPGKDHRNPAARLLFHCSQICRRCESGWQTLFLDQSLQEFADSLQIPLERVTRLVHRFAISAARESYVDLAWSPASRLVLSADRHWATQLKNKPETSATPNPEKPSQTPDEPDKTTSVADALARIKHLVSQKNCTQSDLVNACLKGLSQDVGLGRVSLLILSADKKQLHNRMSLGIEKESSFRAFAIEVERSGLLKILLRKPQAVWVNRDNLKKYHQLLPSSLLASIMTDDFMAMSLFIGDRPIGIVYADHSQGNEQLSDKLFSEFKQLISLTSKALTLLAKR